MRPITSGDVIDFYHSRADLLVLTTAGEYTHLDSADIDGNAGAYHFVTITDGDEVQVLLDRATITEGYWFPDVLDDNGDVNLTPAIADEMAQIILADGILPGRAAKARSAEEDRRRAQEAAEAAALRRAHAVAEAVAYCDGNQSQAGRLLNLDQAVVNRLVAKSRKATVIWSVVRGESPTARAVEPGVAGVDIPDEILAWAAGHGLSMDDPDVYLLVTPADEAGSIDGEIAYRSGTVPAAVSDAIRAQLAEDEENR
jgi:ribosomal protein L25 (general stress protein Ctc)